MKLFFDFIRKESDEFRLPLILMAVFSGIVNGLTVAVAIRSIYMIVPGEVNTGQLVKLLACVVAFWISKEYVLNRTVTIIEKIVKKTRVRILYKIRNTNLIKFEQMDSGRVFSTLSTDAMTISMSAAAAINAASSVVMLGFIVLLIGTSSMTALLITGGMIAVAVVYYMRKSRHVGEQLFAATQKENVFYDNLNGVLQGFKEFKLNRARADDFYQNEINNVIEETTDLRIKAGKTLNHSVLIGQTFLFFTIAGLLFLLPTLKPTDVSIIGILVPIIIFAAGPIGEIVAAVPAVSKAQAAIYNIQSLEAMIDDGLSDVEVNAEHSHLSEPKFETIEFKNVSFKYPSIGSRPFSIKPFNFKVQQGEIIFIVGGNGSGKSTLLKLLTGLYTPLSGSVELNGEVIDENRIAGFRNLFTSIFTDFFLFKRILGVEKIDPDRIQNLLKEFELLDKTQIENGEISNIKLSTGQRKRLALIVASLEEKPICIFDEWAADQDPVFRRYFYNQILPELKKNGKTVIAVTHDDHYFDCADRVLEMDYGELKTFSGSIGKSK